MSERDLSEFENTPQDFETHVLCKIMTAEEYGCSRHSFPYVFELNIVGSELLYFGTQHVSDPESKVLEVIENYFIDFKPDLVFVEAFNVDAEGHKKVSDVARVSTRKEAILNAGESGFVVKLCVENNVEWCCPEPSHGEAFDNLIEHGFSKEELLAWTVVRILPQYSESVERVGFKEYVQRFSDRLELYTKWDGFDYSYEHAMSVVESILGRKIDVENEDDSSRLVEPIPWEHLVDKQSVFNRISEVSTKLRDRKIVTDIAEALKTHKKLFVVYGGSHAVMQEPALRVLAEK